MWVRDEVAPTSDVNVIIRKIWHDNSYERTDCSISRVSVPVRVSARVITTTSKNNAL
jgi:hypothetical protein